MKSIERARTQMLLTVAIAAVATASCTNPPSSDSTSTASASATNSSTRQFPYPRAQFTSDIAVEATERATAAAQLALDVQVLKITHIGNKDNSLLPEINNAVGPFNAALPYDGAPRLPETGGAHYRAVDISEQDGNRWIVTTCRYDTPGVYSSGKDGQLALLDEPHEYHAARSTVELTTEKSAGGETTTVPRLLVVRTSGEEFAQRPGQPNDLERRTCEPFRPEPYVQEPPQPLPSGK